MKSVYQKDYSTFEYCLIYSTQTFLKFSDFCLKGRFHVTFGYNLRTRAMSTTELLVTSISFECRALARFFNVDDNIKMFYSTMIFWRKVM